MRPPARPSGENLWRGRLNLFVTRAGGGGGEERRAEREREKERRRHDLETAFPRQTLKESQVGAKDSRQRKQRAAEDGGHTKAPQPGGRPHEGVTTERALSPRGRPHEGAPATKTRRGGRALLRKPSICICSSQRTGEKSQWSSHRPIGYYAAGVGGRLPSLAEKQALALFWVPGGEGSVFGVCKVARRTADAHAPPDRSTCQRRTPRSPSAGDADNMLIVGFGERSRGRVFNLQMPRLCRREPTDCAKMTYKQCAQFLAFTLSQQHERASRAAHSWTFKATANANFTLLNTVPHRRTLEALPRQRRP
ncbi:uncharacterized protein LOC144066209 [Stigmatopora argus]